MKVWLIKVGETLPTDGKNERPMRTGMLAAALADEGHEVTWWTSTVDHARKIQRSHHSKRIKLRDNLSLILIHSLLYKNNVSIVRVLNHLDTGRLFLGMAAREPRPDIILSCLPTLELSAAAAAFGRRKGLPVVLDIRDMWPDIFVEVFPHRTHTAARLALSPMFWMAKYACRRASGIIGITPNFVDWGVRNAGRERTPYDRCFFFAYADRPPAAGEITQADEKWASAGVGTREDEFVACYFGAISRQFEIETILDAARSLNGGPRKFKFVLCGKGDSLDRYRREASGMGNVLFPGWVDATEIWTLMRRSSVGLAPYRSSPSFVVSIPNKVSEYLSAGLPIVSSLDGLLRSYLYQNGIGVTYPNGGADRMAGILCDLYDHREKLATLSARARQTFTRNHAAERVYAEMIAYLKEIVRVFPNGQTRH